ncbi:MAG: peptide chain release factor N(5)-glutamine methyltransferase [Leptolyngbya sp. SIO3F4]|nr:peptide chain release factor N(5)-glutamine methyltransferase [Leptolyngbya sp. SIO3F4]
MYQWRLQAQADAKKANIPTYEVDWILQGISDLSQTDLSLELYRGRSAVTLRYSLDWLTQQWQCRLAERVPVQYLVGEMPWRDLMLTVTPDVLIPRPETELMVEIVQAWVEQQGISTPMIWADLGTGSGAIAISLAKAFPNVEVLAVDISEAALDIAFGNAQRNHVKNIQFHQSNWLDALGDWQGKLSGIVTNPPYIPSKVLPNLDPEVTNHEPHQALDGGNDGLDDIRLLVDQSRTFLRPGGFWLTEHMQGQAATISNLLASKEAYEDIQIHKDLAGIERFVSAIFCV